MVGRISKDITAAPESPWGSDYSYFPASSSFYVFQPHKHKSGYCASPVIVHSGQDTGRLKTQGLISQSFVYHIR